MTLDTSQILNTEAEAHSFQDGATFGVLVALFLSGSELLTMLGMVLGLGGAKAGRKQILRQSKELLRTDEIRNNPEYAILGFIISFFITFGSIWVARGYAI